jgi:hypothetical protein
LFLAEFFLPRTFAVCVPLLFSGGVPESATGLAFGCVAGICAPRVAAKLFCPEAEVVRPLANPASPGTLVLIAGWIATGISI